jgi:hypothetical protein
LFNQGSSTQPWPGASRILPAEGFLGWRASLTDEDWVEWGALSDEAWYERVSKDFGFDARSKRRPATGASAAAIRAGG